MRRAGRLVRALANSQLRRKHLVVLGKQMRALGRSPGATRPIFVLGKQRSGTTMLMHVFHLHPQVQAYDESASSAAFVNFQIRGIAQIQSLVRQSRFPVVCFKPLADSHRAGDFLEQFPSSRVIWMYRHYNEVAHSALLRFPNGTAPVREACEGKSGQHWFHAGLSPAIHAVLQQYGGQTLTELDYACLTWWARNRMALDGGWVTNERFKLVRYEELVRRPQELFPELFRFLSLRQDERSTGHVRRQSGKRDTRRAPCESIDRLCASLLTELDSICLPRRQVDPQDKEARIPPLATNTADAPAPLSADLKSGTHGS